jgi:carbamoyltransferase
MSVILGITDGDDGGAALLIDGRLVAAVNEERLNRMKMSIGFPSLAIQSVLQLGGVKPEEVDRVAVAALTEVHQLEARPNKGWFQEASTITRVRNEIASALAQPLGSWKWARQAHRRLKKLTLGPRRAGVRKMMKKMGIDAPISYHEHHRCHAIAAFDGSGFEEAVSISLDGGGDGRSSHVYAMDQSSDSLLNELDSFDSIGNYYAYVTHLCGYRASIHEGKITGLAAHGQPIYRDIFNKLIRFEDGQITNVGRLFYHKAISTFRQLLPADWEHEDLAASVQQHLEDVAVQYIRHWLAKSGKTKVCLSGGVFANVLLNQRIADLPECDGVFVFPAMGDGGLAAGAVLCECRSDAGYRGPIAAGSTIDHVYLGPSYSDEEILQELKESGEPYTRFDNIEQTIATLIHEGKVVARFNGPMEFGPRALGNRTILYRTSDPSVNIWLNKRLNRTEFMPFAPACLAGEEERLFDWNPASAKPARYMTITFDCSAWMKEHSPAVVHIDGTARPQIVDPDTNPSFHSIIKHYYELSGVPVVVNTSFNMHEEPIVCTPSDAIRSYLQGKLDNLAIGSFLLGPPPGSSSVET